MSLSAERCEPYKFGMQLIANGLPKKSEIEAVVTRETDQLTKNKPIGFYRDRDNWKFLLALYDGHAIAYARLLSVTLYRLIAAYEQRRIFPEQGVAHHQR